MPPAVYQIIFKSALFGAVDQQLSPNNGSKNTDTQTASFTSFPGQKPSEATLAKALKESLSSSKPTSKITDQESTSSPQLIYYHSGSSFVPTCPETLGIRDYGSASFHSPHEFWFRTTRSYRLPTQRFRLKHHFPLKLVESNQASPIWGWLPWLQRH